MKKSKKKYSLPLYEDGIKTEFTVDFEEGDDKWKTLMNIHNEIPKLINVKTKKIGRYKIEFSDGIDEITNPEGFEYNYEGDTGLSIGEKSNNIDLAVKILLQNTKEGQLKSKGKNDTTEIKHSIHILQAVQSEGILDRILADDSSIELLITKIK